MTKPMVRVHNAETDEIIDREMTDEEFTAYQENQALDATRQAEIEAKAKAKADLLAKLGISAEEAKLLLS